MVIKEGLGWRPFLADPRYLVHRVNGVYPLKPHKTLRIPHPKNAHAQTQLYTNTIIELNNQ